jgi:phenylpropionate dioxygenase-like ring-hydroxylating dioxygenase large terminal subunit
VSRDVAMHFHPVMRASRLRDKPVRVELAGVPYALWRDNGVVRAVPDRCPHRHAPLSAGVVRPDGRLACGYHGWHVGGDGEMRSPAVPKLRCSLAALDVVERLGWVWIARPGARMPELDTAGFDLIGSHAMHADAPLHVVVDNFSENEHTPYVHGRLGWREQDAPRVELDVHCHVDRTEVAYHAPQRPSALLPLVLVRGGDTLHNEWVTRFSPVHSIYTLSWTDAKTGARRPYSLRVVVVFVPETDARTHIISFVFSRLVGRHLIPKRVIDAASFAMSWKEVWDDARWLRRIADTQVGFEGMRLTRFDKPLAHGRELMDRLYYGTKRAISAS